MVLSALFEIFEKLKAQLALFWNAGEHTDTLENGTLISIERFENGISVGFF